MNLLASFGAVARVGLELGLARGELAGTCGRPLVLEWRMVVVIRCWVRWLAVIQWTAGGSLLLAATLAGRAPRIFEAHRTSSGPASGPQRRDCRARRARCDNARRPAQVANTAARTRTIECSRRLWPSPPMYAVTSLPLESRTRADLTQAPPSSASWASSSSTWRQTPALERAALEHRRLRLVDHGPAGFPDQLIDRGHELQWFHFPPVRPSSI